MQEVKVRSYGKNMKNLPTFKIDYSILKNKFNTSFCSIIDLNLNKIKKDYSILLKYKKFFIA